MQTNYYATKVYEEHPIALWPLDESTSYISLLKFLGYDDITNATNWNYQNVATIDIVSQIPPDTPTDSPTYEVLANTDDPIIITSDPISVPDKFPITLSMYGMASTGTARTVEIGFLYDGIYHAAAKSGGIPGDWVRYFSTERNGVPVTSFQIYIKIEQLVGLDPAPFYINGLHAGELSENFVANEPGCNPTTVPSTLSEIFPSDARLVPAYSYGTGDRDIGYYAAVAPSPYQGFNGLMMVAKNNGIPMVYGASGVTQILQPRVDMPCVLLPGHGFMHETGKTMEHTFEFWMRQGRLTKAITKYQSTTARPRMIKFFGPAHSTDGLYRDDSSIYLSVGKSLLKYHVGNWYRPMLVTITLGQNDAKLFINSEYAGSVSCDRSEFPIEESKDWVGFWNRGIDVFEIDSPAIFTYRTSLGLTRRRYATAQAVNEISSIDGSFLGKSVTFDYTNSNYYANMMFPTTRSWHRGTLSNLRQAKDRLKFPAYNLPRLDSKFSSTNDPTYNWNNFLAQNTYNSTSIPSFKIDPTGLFKKTSRLVFESMELAGERIKSIELDIGTTSITSTYTILSIDDIRSGDNYVLTIDSDSLELKKNGAAIGEGITASYTADRISVILDLELLGVSDQVDVFALGDRTKSFKDNVYAVTFYNSIMHRIRHNTSSVLVATAKSLTAEITIGSYTLAPTVYPKGGTIEIKTAGMWEDMVPMTYFAKIFADSAGALQNRFDLLQFNTYIDYSPASGLRDNAIVEARFLDSEYTNSAPYEEYFRSSSAGNFLKLTDQDIDGTYHAISDKMVFLVPNESDISKKFMKVAILFEGTEDSYAPTSRLDISSMTFAKNGLAFFDIGTKYAAKTYPATYSNGFHYPPSSIPIRMSRDSGPYLRVTDDSGICIVPKVSGNSIVQENSCIVVPMGSNTKLAGFKMWVTLTEEFRNEITQPKKIAEVILPLENRTERVQIYVEKESDEWHSDPDYATYPNRYRVVMYKDGSEYKSWQTFQDLSDTEYPVLEPMKWTQISVVFDGFRELVDSAYLNIYSGIVVQNLSIHDADSLAIGSKIAYRLWYMVQNEDVQDNTLWEYWYGETPPESSDPTWTNVLAMNQFDLADRYFDAKTLTNSLFGTVGIVSSPVGTNELKIASSGTRTYSNVKWDSELFNVYKPA